MRTSQLSLLPKLAKSSTSFGGSLLHGRRKAERPISAKRPMHLVLKSTQAVGTLSFVNHRRSLEVVLQRCARKWGVRLMDHQWNWNHLHVVILVPNRTIYHHWIRELTGSVVRTLEGKTGIFLRRFFDHRPFTRVLQWGRDLQNALAYLELNEMEIFGCRPPKKTTFGRSKPGAGRVGAHRA